jgi:hypothetical protein
MINKIIISNYLFNKTAKAISLMDKEQKQAFCLEYKFTSIVGEYYNDNDTSNEISIYSDAITLRFTIKNKLVNVESNFGGHIRCSAEKIQEDLLYIINLIDDIEVLFLGLTLK